MQVMMDIYEKVERTFGYRQLTLHMRKQTGKAINHKRVYRLMKLKAIQSVIRRKKPKYMRSTPQQVAENLLNREFQATAPNEKWVTDVTDSNNNPLVFQTLERALQAAPGSKPMLHSDRGFQYTSLDFKKILDENKMSQSMSRVGRCIDNGPMESFWGTLKCEKYHLHRYETFDDLKRDIEAYICFYDNERLQAKLNGLSPMEFRNKAA